MLKSHKLEVSQGQSLAQVSKMKHMIDATTVMAIEKRCICNKVLNNAFAIKVGGLREAQFSDTN